MCYCAFSISVVKMKHMSVLCFIGIILLGIVECKTPQLPDYFKICRRNADLDKCIVDSVNSLKGNLADGIPTLKMPPLDPLLITKAEYQDQNTFMEFFDTVTHKMSAFEVTGVHMDLDNYILIFNFTVPAPSEFGTYRIRGKLATFDIDSKGPYSINATNLSYHGKAHGKLIQKHGKDYIQFESLDSDIKFTSYKVQLDNLIPSNEELTATINNVLNESSGDLLEAVLKKTLGEVVLSLIRQVFNQFPLDVLIPKE